MVAVVTGEADGGVRVELNLAGARAKSGREIVADAERAVVGEVEIGVRREGAGLREDERAADGGGAGVGVRAVEDDGPGVRAGDGAQAERAGAPVDDCAVVGSAAPRIDGERGGGGAAVIDDARGAACEVVEGLADPIEMKRTIIHEPADLGRAGSGDGGRCAGLDGERVGGIGTASLAQVHIALRDGDGKKVVIRSRESQRAWAGFGERGFSAAIGNVREVERGACICHVDGAGGGDYESISIIRRAGAGEAQSAAV